MIRPVTPFACRSPIARAPEDARSGAMVASRRQFLGGAAAGLTLALSLPGIGRAQTAAAIARPEDGQTGLFAPNAFIRIGTDNTVTVIIKHLEMGQGPWTGLATLVAEELDADWSQMRAAHAPTDVTQYANMLFGIQGTGGSTAMANSYTQMRQAGAAARALLVRAAAERWGVPTDTITVQAGVVRHPDSSREATFGQLTQQASTFEAPVEAVLKDPGRFTLIGTDRPRLDTVEKVNGHAQFTLDVYRDGMLVAVLARPEVFGATVASVDDSAALAVPGVEAVRQLPQGVAVYARNTYAALKGREALKIEWDLSRAETRSSAELFQLYAQAIASGQGIEAAIHGDPGGTLQAAATVHEAEFRFPFLAHAPMEPLDAVIALNADAADGPITSAEVWMGSQLQTTEHQTIAETLGLDPAAVQLQTMLAGGSFGRRAQGDSHFAREVAEVARALGRPGTVKLMWTREDDIQGGYYRPLGVHRLRASLDEAGQINAWDHDIAVQSIVAGTPFAMLIVNGIDATSIEGARELPYGIPNFRCTLHTLETGVPILWWRSVGHTHTAYSTETFLDELLEKAGRDPVAGRLAMIGDGFARERAVLERVADMAGWSGPRVSDTITRGVALQKSFNSYVAHIAEISHGDNRLPRVRKVWVAVDCGVPVNPNIIKAQMEGGAIFGLGAALFDEITLGEGGRVMQRNWDTYRMIRINEAPPVEVSIIDSTADPTGVGEPGVPPIAPAVANAWRVLTGQSVRRLPFLTATA